MSNRLNKQDLVNKLAETEVFDSKKAATEALEVVISTIRAAVVAGNSVSISDFGVFSVAERAARTGRNPQTGKALDIPASLTPKFKAFTSFKSDVNGK